MENIPHLVECYKVGPLRKGDQTSKPIKDVIKQSEDQREVYPTHFHEAKERSIEVYEKPTR